jgi:hypothetical protein
MPKMVAHIVGCFTSVKDQERSEIFCRHRPLLVAMAAAYHLFYFITTYNKYFIIKKILKKYHFEVL